jgi:MerR family transcriptional regulator, redox-sensitive transcriptional activator SoxR
MKEQHIGDIAKKSGVPASTIRYYEEIELLPPAHRVNGRRRYDGAILQKINLIRLAQKAGFTIAEIQTLLHDFPEDAPPSDRWQVMARKKLDELDERLKTIHAMKGILVQTLQCQCNTLEDCGTGIPDHPQAEKL